MGSINSFLKKIWSMLEAAIAVSKKVFGGTSETGGRESRSAQSTAPAPTCCARGHGGHALQTQVWAERLIRGHLCGSFACVLRAYPVT